MTRVWLWLGIMLVSALVVHATIVLATPSRVTAAAWQRIAAQGGLNAWMHAPMVTEKARTVVRPSPDLAYSACAYDLSKGPVRITSAPWDGYLSVSAYAANSDNFFVTNNKSNPAGIDITLVEKDASPPKATSRLVVSPTTRGIVLQRRLAPTKERFDAAAAARKADICQPLGGAGNAG